MDRAGITPRPRAGGVRKSEEGLQDLRNAAQNENVSSFSGGEADVECDLAEMHRIEEFGIEVVRFPVDKIGRWIELSLVSPVGCTGSLCWA